MKIKQIKEITILGSKFRIEWDKTHGGGWFSFKDGVINIGITKINTDPLYTLRIISHELMEIILTYMGSRYDNPRMENNYLFNFGHQTFETAIDIHTELLVKFIQTK